MLKAFRPYFIFFLVPGIVLGFSFLFKLAAGPYWLAPNLDPAYQYLVNGVYLLKGFVPNHTDHPGTPLQMLCCAVFFLINIGRSLESAVNQVLAQPEFYLQNVFVLLTIFSFVTSIALAIYVFRKTNDQLAALLSQLPMLSFLVLKSWETFEPVIPVVANVSPEPMLIGIVNLFNICLFKALYAKNSKEEIFAGLFWGIICGFGVAVKLTFLPLLIIPLIVLSWKNKVFYITVCLGSFVVGTFPIISKYALFWGWIKGIILHTGIYGSGNTGIIETSTYFFNCRHIVLEEGIFIGIILLSAFVLFWKIFTKKWNREIFFLLAVMIGILFQFALVAKHPGAHYLLPGLGLFSALLVLFYLQGPMPHVLGRRIVLIVIILAILLGAGQANAYRLKLGGLTRQILSFQAHADAAYQKSVFIDYYRSSSPTAALFFGDGWNLSPRLGKELALIYPNKYYFNVWGNQILSFNSKVWTNDLLAQGKPVLFRGSDDFDFSQGPFHLQALEKGPFENISILTGTTEKQAAMLMAGSMHFFQTGEYAKALAWALGARQLHYQPDSAVEGLIHLIKPYTQGH